MGAHLKAKKAPEWYEATLHEPGREQYSCEDTEDTPDATHTHHSAGIARGSFQSARSPDLDPFDTWAWNAVKRERFAVRGRLPLEAEASWAWAAVLRRSPRGCCVVGRVALHHVSQPKVTLFEHVSTESLEM